MAKKFLTLNIGYSAIALAEYESSGASLTMVNYGTASLAAPLDAGNADTVLSRVSPRFRTRAATRASSTSWSVTRSSRTSRSRLMR